MRDLKVRLSHVLTDVHCLASIIWAYACLQLHHKSVNIFSFPCFFVFFCWLRFLSNWPLYIIDQQRDFFKSVELFVNPCLLVIGNARKTFLFFCIVLICQHLNIELWFKTFVIVSIQDSESIDEIPEKREEEEQLNLQEMSEVISQGLLTFVEFKGLISNHCF